MHEMPPKGELEHAKGVSEKLTGFVKENLEASVGVPLGIVGILLMQSEHQDVQLVVAGFFLASIAWISVIAGAVRSRFLSENGEAEQDQSMH